MPSVGWRLLLTGNGLVILVIPPAVASDPLYGVDGQGSLPASKNLQNDLNGVTASKPNCLVRSLNLHMRISKGFRSLCFIRILKLSSLSNRRNTLFWPSTWKTANFNNLKVRAHEAC